MWHWKVLTKNSGITFLAQRNCCSTTKMKWTMFKSRQATQSRFSSAYPTRSEPCSSQGKQQSHFSSEYPTNGWPMTIQQCWEKAWIYKNQFNGGLQTSNLSEAILSTDRNYSPNFRWKTASIFTSFTWIYLSAIISFWTESFLHSVNVTYHLYIPSCLPVSVSPNPCLN
jgi:hypothetical protein